MGKKIRRDCGILQPAMTEIDSGQRPTCTSARSDAVILHSWPSDRFAVTHPRWEPYAGKAARTVLGGGRELNSRHYHVPQSQRKVVDLKPCNLLFGLTSGFPQMAGGSAWGKIDSNIRATNLIGDVITKMKRNHATRPI